MPVPGECVAKLHRAATAQEIADFADDPNRRLVFNPSGLPGVGTWATGSSVPWKLLRKAPGESLSDYLSRMKGINEGAAKGLAAAIKDSEGKKGVRGFALVQMSSGLQLMMPRKAAEQSIGKPLEVTVGGKTRVIDRAVKILKVRPTARGLMPAIVVPAAAIRA